MNDQVNLVIEQIKKEKDIFTKAKLINFLRKKKDVSLKEIAHRLQLTSSYVCHILRLNHLPEIIVDGYYSDQITVSHLFILSRIKDKDKVVLVYEKVLTDSLTVFQTEELVREALYDVETQGDYLSKNEKNLLIDKFKNISQELKIKIVQTRIKSKVVIEIKGSALKTSSLLKKLLKNISLN